MRYAMPFSTWQLCSPQKVEPFDRLENGGLRHLSRDKDGCTPNVRVPMVFSWCSTLGLLGIITHKYPLYRAYIGISHRGTLGSGYIQLSPEPWIFCW